MWKYLSSGFRNRIIDKGRDESTIGWRQTMVTEKVIDRMSVTSGTSTFSNDNRKLINRWVHNR